MGEEQLIEELTEDLTEELKVTDSMFNSSLLETKVKAAIRDVKRARRYPDSYTDTQIANDLYRFYPICRNIALYDYNSIGMEGQRSSSENGTNRTFFDRKLLFRGVTPIANL